MPVMRVETCPCARTGLTWIVERSFAWLGRNRRLSKDYEYRVQTSETMIDIAAARLGSLNVNFQTASQVRSIGTISGAER